MKRLIKSNARVRILLAILTIILCSSAMAQAPTITSFNPQFATAGTTIIVKGKKLTGATSVKFGGVAATSFSILNDSTISAVVGACQSGLVSVKTNAGDASTGWGSYLFIYVTQPTITSYSVSNQTVGGYITIHGTGFSSATDIKIGGGSVLYFPKYFGVVMDDKFRYYGDTAITIWLGTNNTSGDISITNPLGTASISGFTVDAQPNNIWTGGVSEDFSLAANWSNGVLPATNAKITIPFGTYNSPVIFRDTTLYKMVLDGYIKTVTTPAKATLTLKDSVSGIGYFYSGSLIIDGNIGSPIAFYGMEDITIKSGSVTFSSDGKAKIEHLHIDPLNDFYIDNSNFVKNLTIKGGTLTIAGSRYMGYTEVENLSSKGGILNTNDMFAFINDPKVTYPITGTINGKVRSQCDRGFYANFTDYGAPVVGAKAGDISSKTYTYTNGVWSSILSPNTLLVPGTGYRVLFKNDTTTNTGLGLEIGTFKGTLISTNISPTITQGANAFSFVANPYFGRLDFEKLTTTNLQSGYWYLDPTHVDDSGYLGYVYYGTLTGASNTFSGGLSLDKYIQRFQGFFVQNQNNSLASSLTFSTSAIDNSQSPRSVFGTPSLNRIATGLFANGKNLDGAVAVFNSSFSNGFDKNDGTKFSNHGENLTFQVSGKDFCANAWSLPSSTDELLMHLYNLKANTSYTIKLDASQFDGNGLVAYLKDNNNNTQYMLSGNNNEVSFTTTADATAFANRYSIVFGKSALPVRNICLSVSAIRNNQAVLNWKSVGESNISNYKVEHSINGTSFTDLATVSPSTTHNYSYTDAANYSKDGGYYRIKATDITGAIAYSNVAKLAITKQEPLTVFPNPVTNGNFSISLDKIGIYTISLVDKLGRSVYTNTINHNAAATIENIYLGKNLSGGSYILTATDNLGNTNTTTLIIK